MNGREERGTLDFGCVRGAEGGYRSLFEAASDGMVLADEAGSIRDANASARRLLGREDPVGVPLDTLFDPIDVRLEPAREELREAGSFDGQLLVRRADGTSFTADVALRRGGDGGVSAVFRSLGERERLDGASGDANWDGEARFRALVHGTPDLVALVGVDGTVGYISPAVERTHGFRPEEVEGRNLLELVHPEDHAAAAKDLHWTAANPGTVGLAGPVVRVAHRDGSWRHLEAFVSNHLDDPNVGALLFNCRDVTDRVRLEEELRASEERFRALVENAQDFVVLGDENNVCRYVSPSIERIMGYTPEEFVGTVTAGYVHPDDLEAALRQIAEFLPIPGPHNLGAWRYRHKDGSYRYLETVVNNKMNDPVLRGVVCNCRDVTERVEAEKALRESEERHRALSENALDFVVVQRYDNTLSYVSPSIERLLGYTPEEVIGTLGADYIHPEDLEWAWPTFYKQLETPGLNEPVTIRYGHKDGGWRWFESACNNQLHNPAVEGLVFNCRDVTERVEAEEELKASEERFRALVENAHDFVVLADENNVALYASPGMERAMGYAPDEFVGTVIASYVHPDDLEAALYEVAQSLSTPGPHTMSPRRHRRKDGSYRYIEAIVNNRLEDPILRGVVCNCRDVTERVEAEKQLREAEERYRLLVEQVPAATYIERNDMDSSTVYVSPQIEKMLGYTPEEWISDPELWLRSLHPEDHGRVFARHLRCNETGEPFDEEYRAFAKDGREVWVSDEARLVRDEAGETLYWQGVKVDITGRKKAELEILRLNTELRGQVAGYTAELKAAIERLKDSERHLRQREERFHATFERAAVGIAHVSPNGRWLQVNEKLCEILGYERAELLRKNFQDVTHPDDLDLDLGQVRRVLDGEIGTYSIEKRYLRKDGSVMWANLTVSLVRDTAREPDYFISVIEDASRRKGAEVLLKLLSPREVEVLGEMVQGSTNAEIAKKMGFSANTIKSNVSSITEKLGASDRTQAAVYAVEVGLFTPRFRVPDKLPVAPR